MANKRMINGYDNTSDMVRDAVAYFVKMAERNER